MAQIPINIATPLEDLQQVIAAENAKLVRLAMGRNSLPSRYPARPGMPGALLGVTQ
jgi:hypothetical protein